MIVVLEDAVKDFVCIVIGRNLNMIKYLDCGKCIYESHTAWNCTKLGHCWTSAMGEMPYAIRLPMKNLESTILFWESING
jgi:hypothetical protein